MDIYKLALTHSSYSKDHPHEPNNERLEFYGDAVLKLVFSKYLYYRFNQSGEGTLTKYRSKLISDDMLSQIGYELDFDKKIIVGSSLNKKKKPKSIIGDALEAYIGAVYIDKGFDEAEKFILKNWEPFIDKCIEDSKIDNYKANLQELLQKDHNEPPIYDVIKESGPDHDKKFTIGVYFQGKLLGKGKGANKKEASQMAAKDALTKFDANNL